MSRQKRPRRPSPGVPPSAGQAPREGQRPRGGQGLPTQIDNALDSPWSLVAFLAIMCAVGIKILVEEAGRGSDDVPFVAAGLLLATVILLLQLRKAIRSRR